MVPDLATLLNRHREEIATAWAGMIYQYMPASNYCARPPHELRVALMLDLEVITDLLTTGSCRARETAGLVSIIDLIRAGFHIGEVIEATLLGKEAVLPFIWRTYPPDSAAAREAMAQNDACMRRLVGDIVTAYATEASRRLREEQERTATMLDIVRTVSSTLELDEVLRRASKAIATTVGARYCWFYLVDGEQALSTFFVETDELPLSVKPYLQDFLNRTRELAPDFLVPNDLARQVLKHKRPFACYDAQTDPFVTHTERLRRMDVKSFLLVPCIAKGRVLAIGVVTTFDDHRIFTEEQIELAWGIANTIAPAIENARLYQKVEQLAAMEERARLAREMHDRLAQELAYLKLKTSTASQLLASGQIARTQAGLLELKQYAEEVYTDTREAIFNLRTIAASDLGFLPTLRQYVATYRACYDVDVRLVADGESAIALPTDTGIQVMRIIQEALTNVRRHTRANEAWIRFEQDGDQVCITVEDHGQGFDSAQAMRKDQHHFGLQIMRERAQSVGGSLELVSQPGQGTQVVIRVPLTPGR